MFGCRTRLGDVVNRWTRGALMALPSFVLVVVILVAPRLDVSRTTRAVIIVVSTVACIGALVLIAVWLNRRSQQP